ncbi:MAG: hypothetical protein AB1589_02335 [Cyanobacteriota bacterium]
MSVANHTSKLPAAKSASDFSGGFKSPEFTRLSTLRTTFWKPSHLRIRSQFVALWSTIKQAYRVEVSVVDATNFQNIVKANITRKEAHS